MQNFKTFIVEGIETDLMGLLKSFGAGEVTISGDVLSTRLRKKQQVFDIIAQLPASVDYEVIVYEIDNDTAEREEEEYEDEDGNDAEMPIAEIGMEDLTDQFHEYELMVYLYNMDTTEIGEGENVEDSIEEATELTERRRTIKINAKGKRRIKIKCKKGYKWTGSKCVKISGAEKTKKRRSIRKAVRTKKAKGKGYQKRIQRLRKRALKKRSGMGLKSSFEPVGTTLAEDGQIKQTYSYSDMEVSS